MRTKPTLVLITLLLVGLLAGSVSAQKAGFNYDESKVPEYELPDPLVLEDGQRVRDAASWTRTRRAEILALFEKEVYGRIPEREVKVRFEELTRKPDALSGQAVRKEVAVHLEYGARKHTLHLLLFLPKDAEGAVPTFLALNFWGNHSIHPSPDIRLSSTWMRRDDARGVADHRALEESRGKSSSRWPLESILARGYGVATLYCGDIDPDYHDGFGDGVHRLLDGDPAKERPGDAWGTISAWAWGLSRAMDCLEEDPEVDASRVIVMGHSRLGKTALWAGALDRRFAMVISNNSGCGGAALSRRRFGETVRRINDSFPHWFCGNFKKYNDRENDLPVDQHQLIALAAPRPVYVASAERDRWADPRGEFLAVKHADPVYRLLGTAGLGANEMPALEEPVHGAMGYHIRRGKHDVTPYDWERYMDFADKHLKNKRRV